MKKLTLVLSVLLFTSCAGFRAKKKARICSTCPATTKVRDSIVTVIKDTTLFVEVPGPTKVLANPCSELCDSVGNLRPGFQKIVVKDNWRTVIRTVHDSIEVQTTIDSAAVSVKWNETHSYRQEQKTVEVERKKTKFEKFQTWFFWIVIAMVVGWGTARLLR